MSFAAPIWLVGLLPWAAVTIWLLAGRRRRQVVPFLPLWQGEAALAKPRRAVQPPPVALAAALLAMLLMVLAAGRPMAGRMRSSGRVSVIVDHGMGLSAKGKTGRRYAELAAAVQPRLRALAGPGPLRLIGLPGEAEQTDRDHWASVAAALPPTAVDSSAALPATIAAQLRESRGPLVVLTDQPVEVSDDRVIVVRPATTPRDVGIVSMAVREQPSPQVMVRLRNAGGGAVDAKLEIRSGSVVAERVVQIPAADEVNAFIPLSGALGDVAEAELFVNDDMDANNRAWLVRGHERPRLEARSPLPEALQRMVAVYQRAAPAGERSTPIAVVAAAPELRGIEPGVIYSPPLPASHAATQPAPSLHVVADEVTALVNWAAAVRDVETATAPPPPGWMPIVTLGDRVLVAKRAEPARQVWVGFDSPAWPRTADYVVFWANVFDWVGGGAAGDFSSDPVEPLGPEWSDEDGHLPVGTPPGLWPGLYRRADGARRAIHAPLIQIAATAEVNWEQRWAGVAARMQTGGTPLAASLLLAAVGCMVVAAATWRRGQSSRM